MAEPQEGVGGGVAAVLICGAVGHVAGVVCSAGGGGGGVIGGHRGVSGGRVWLHVRWL